MTVREINEAVERDRYVYAHDALYNTRFRIIRARTRRGVLEGRSLTSGRWYPIGRAEVV